MDEWSTASNSSKSICWGLGRPIFCCGFRGLHKAQASRRNLSGQIHAVGPDTRPLRRQKPALGKDSGVWKHRFPFSCCQLFSVPDFSGDVKISVIPGELLMAPSRRWWGKGSRGALHLTPGKAALQLAAGIENVKRNGWNRPKGKRSAQRATRAQATGIAAEIERSEIAAQSPAAKRVAQKHRRAIHATNDRPVCPGRCRRVQLERLGPSWARESASHLFKISELERTGRGPPAHKRADTLPRAGAMSTEWTKSSRCTGGRRIRITFSFLAADANLPRRGQNTLDRGDRDISDGRRRWTS